MPTTTYSEAQLREHLERLRQRIAAAAHAAGREPKAVTLIAVSKTQPTSVIQAAFHLGQRDFAENYLQEAAPKLQALQTQTLTWHYIGQLQAKKCKAIAEQFSWVHSVTRLKELERLNAHRPSMRTALNVCIEINIDDEPTKSGLPLAEVEPFLVKLPVFSRLRVRGLMVLPAPHQDAQHRARAFMRAKQLFEHLRQQGFDLDTLSMGTSEDFEQAIDCGSTMVRVGRGLFGERKL